jgi:glutamyl-Q tRNA(Asp) synthetase
LANDFGGTALLRIEDTDSTRARAKFIQGIYDDLEWLGLTWPSPVLKQSEHYESYWSVLELLAERGLVYPCSCHRRAIQEAGAQHGADGYVYPGTCRLRKMTDAAPTDAIRLNLKAAFAILDSRLSYVETGSRREETIEISPSMMIDNLGDPVLRRKETADPAYHLACVHDDAVQSVTHVVRGKDVQNLTPIHVVLQRLMGWPTPIYHHHALITDGDGKRLAKVDQSKAIATYRADGATPNDIRNLVGFPEA